ncbi:hypothetical protein H4R34_002207 [Dimargaris verticillata]|uniref:DUF4112 domain-containing protein n=1 Tax=Dimargaris verticillata TaxID=2761393 RepID=A0A9W8B996_9FUNG|nr:hypothetical protein H4R34_002207 [Dimargaris verticillata]
MAADLGISTTPLPSRAPSAPATPHTGVDVTEPDATPVTLYHRLNETTQFDPEVVQRTRSRIARIAKTMDAMPGLPVKVGLDAIIGLIPAIGDILCAAIALYVVYLASTLNIPKGYKARMASNVGIDGLVGTVPLVGDVFDVLYKANLRNLELLDKWIAKKHTERKAEWARLQIAYPHLFLLSDPPSSLKEAAELNQRQATLALNPSFPAYATEAPRWKFWKKSPHAA